MTFSGLTNTTLSSLGKFVTMDSTKYPKLQYRSGFHGVIGLYHNYISKRHDICQKVQPANLLIYTVL